MNIFKKIYDSLTNIWEKIFTMFTNANIWLIAPFPGSYIVRQINVAWWNLIDSQKRNISTTLFENWPDNFRDQLC